MAVYYYSNRWQKNIVKWTDSKERLCDKNPETDKQGNMPRKIMRMENMVSIFKTFII